MDIFKQFRIVDTVERCTVCESQSWKGDPLPGRLLLLHPTEPSLGPAQPHSVAHQTSVLLSELVAILEDMEMCQRRRCKGRFCFGAGIYKTEYGEMLPF